MKTNLVVIMTDEQSANTIGAYGNSLIRTPNIDTLAARSILFERAYVTQPVCTASRASLLTGLYPHTSGCTENNVTLADDVRTLPELLGYADYRCAYIGKWHLGDEIFQQHGFDEWISIEDAYRGYYSQKRDRRCRSSYDAFLRSTGYVPDVSSDDGIGTFSRGFSARLPENHTKASFVGSESVNYIHQNKDCPFVLYAAFLEPHMPFFGPRDDEYADVEIPLPVSHEDKLCDKALKTRLFSASYRRNGHSGVELSSMSGWRQLIRQYWGLVSMVDHQIGRIVDAIDSAGIADRTIIVFTSDHGDMMGAHGLVGKCVMFEEAIRAPLSIALPEEHSSRYRIDAHRYRSPVSQVDLVPTLLEFLGHEPNAEFDGRSIVPRLVDHRLGGLTEGYADENDVVVEWNGMNSGFGDVLGDTRVLPEWLEFADELIVKSALDDPVRTLITPDGWKYTWSHRGEDTLFHLPSDPAEMLNLINAVDSDFVLALRGRIERWQQKTMDAVVFG